MVGYTSYQTKVRLNGRWVQFLVSHELSRDLFFWSVIFGTAARGRRNETAENRRFSDERCLRAMMMLMMPYDVVATVG